MLSESAMDYYQKVGIDPNMLLKRGIKRGHPEKKCYATMEYCYEKIRDGKTVAPWEIYKYVENCLPKKDIIIREIVTKNVKNYVTRINGERGELRAKNKRLSSDNNVLRVSNKVAMALLTIVNLFFLYLFVR